MDKSNLKYISKFDDLNIKLESTISALQLEFKFFEKNKNIKYKDILKAKNVLKYSTR